LISQLVERAEVAAENGDMMTATLFYLYASHYDPTDVALSERVKTAWDATSLRTANCPNQEESTRRFGKGFDAT